ncbi:ATPase, partial [Enterobacter asburiae]|nr:ATPase [Enterobacter asburiae]HDT1481978.1 ATPase [Enterobacter asburiae]
MSLQTELNELMSRKGYSQTQVARAFGKSPAVVNQYLQGKYQGDVGSIDELARSFIAREADKEKSRRITPRYIPTVTSRKGIEVIRLAHLDGEINVLYGAAGLGKTMILREYASRHRDALLIEADPGYTARVVLEELCG